MLRIVSGKEERPLWLKLQSGQSWLSPSGDGDLLEALLSRTQYREAICDTTRDRVLVLVTVLGQCGRS